MTQRGCIRTIGKRDVGELGWGGTQRGGDHSPPHSDAPKVVRVIVNTRHKAKRLIPIYSWGSGDV